MTQTKENTMPLLAHLDELRSVLIWILVFAAVGTGIAYLWHPDIIALLTKPLTTPAGEPIKPVIIRPAEGFFASLKVSFFAGLVVASPAIFWKIWSFIVPALYPHERRWVYIFLPVSVLLFVGGVVFAYMTVFQVGVKFLIAFGDFNPMISINEYLSFALTFILPFGIVFQLPLVTLFLVRIGVVSRDFLARYRKHALLVMFIVAAVFTPTPDMVSQTLMALPMYLLYEVSVQLARFVRPRPATDPEPKPEEALSPREGP
ncbi:MAG: twin-arginine translocase subunit TatC [Heliobacteriaceae bacterium]|nr:twin-arginine translocase subunit TatC [Heliobacteriaceae bacterium]